jgi:hypothetical protein
VSVAFDDSVVRQQERPFSVLVLSRSKRVCCSASSGLTFIQGASSGFHFFQDVGGSRGPDERFRAFVMTVDVGADGDGEFFQIAKDAAPEPIVSEVAKERSTMFSQDALVGVKWS